MRCTVCFLADMTQRRGRYRRELGTCEGFPDQSPAMARRAMCRKSAENRALAACRPRLSIQADKNQGTATLTGRRCGHSKVSLPARRGTLAGTFELRT